MYRIYKRWPINIRKGSLRMKLLGLPRFLNYTSRANTTCNTLLRVSLGATAFAVLGSTLVGQTAQSVTPLGGVQRQIMSFGDSRSNAGTYKPLAQKFFGGGEYTTNLGKLWTQQVTVFYGDNLTLSFVGGAG